MRRTRLVWTVLCLLAGCGAPSAPTTAPTAPAADPGATAVAPGAAGAATQAASGAAPAQAPYILPGAALAPAAPASAAVPAFAAPWRLASTGRAVATTGDARLAVDGDPTTEWNPRAYATAEAPQDLALALSAPAKGALCAVWHGHGMHYQNYGYGKPRSYTIEVSADSADGRDGHWREVARVSDNAVRSRAQVFDAPGARWVRFRFLDVWDNFDPEPFLREVAIYERAGDGANDCWLIMGDSVTSVAFDPALPDEFAEVVETRHPAYHPICLSGGTGGDQSGDALERLQVGLPTLPAGSVVGLLYGSNDASHGVSLDDYRTRMQAAIDDIRAQGHVPIVGVVPWSLNGQIDRYAQVCRDLQAANGLPPGPDFYTYFKAHPDQLATDKVHPNAEGIKAMQRLWAEAADFRYAR